MSSDQYKKSSCRYCDEKLEAPFLELGSMPLANSLVKPEDTQKPEFECPLSLCWCLKCNLVQLSHVVPPDLMFKHYLYVSSTTQTFRDHFAEYAQTVKGKLAGLEQPLAVDIGSNDGLLLSCFQKEGMRIVGVDPAENLAKEANNKGLTTLNRYFDAECVKEITSKYGKAHAISANNVFAHIDDIQAVCRNVADLLDEQGIFTIEFPYLVTMLEELLFDMIYHEHVSYIAVKPLEFLLNRFGLEIFDIQEVSSHGGSLRVFIQKQNSARPIASCVQAFKEREEAYGCHEEACYERFAAQVNTIKHNFCELINEFCGENKKIVGYGAPAKASTILNFYEIGPDQITCVIDDNPLKQNMLIPGVQIPIVSSEILETENLDVVVIFAWNFAKEILKKIGYLENKGIKFILPLPGAGPSEEGLESAKEFYIKAT